MQQKIYLVLVQFILYFYHQCDYVAAKPMVGQNVRQVRTRDEYPFVVSIMRINNESKRREVYQSCTGTLISKRDVLTAAHCLEIEKVHPIQVIVGSHDIRFGKKYSIDWWIIYNEWALFKELETEYKDNDIGIIRLSQNISDDIPIAKLWTTPNFDVNGLDVHIAGWGISNDGEHPTILETVNLKILKRKDCEKKMTTLLRIKIRGDERFLCSTAKPYALISFGDSGGPLLYRDSVIGINRGTCPYSATELDKVNLHFAINYYKSFIEDIVANFNTY